MRVSFDLIRIDFYTHSHATVHSGLLFNLLRVLPVNRELNSLLVISHPFCHPLVLFVHFHFTCSLLVPSRMFCREARILRKYCYTGTYSVHLHLGAKCTQLSLTGRRAKIHSSTNLVIVLTLLLVNPELAFCAPFVKKHLLCFHLTGAVVNIFFSHSLHVSRCCGTRNSAMDHFHSTQAKGQSCIFVNHVARPTSATSIIIQVNCKFQLSSKLQLPFLSL